MKKLFSFIETASFAARASECLTDDALAELQWFLIAHPDAGAVIIGSSGLRKLRWALPGRGKRGGARVIYYWADARGQIFLLDIYAKNEQSELSSDEIKDLKKVVEQWLQ